jgi:predicted RNase H-like HicB family nuclease
LQKFFLTFHEGMIHNTPRMKQRYHTIIKLVGNGTYVGWVEEIPGALTHGHSLEECRENLRDSLQLMIETHRDEARLALDTSCIQESIEIDLTDSHALASVGAGAAGDMSPSHV